MSESGRRGCPASQSERGITTVTTWEAERRKEQASALRACTTSARRLVTPLVKQLVPVAGTHAALDLLAEAAYAPENRIAGRHDLERRIPSLAEFDLGVPVAYFDRFRRGTQGARKVTWDQQPLLITDTLVVLLGKQVTSKKIQTFDLSDVKVVEAREEPRRAHVRVEVGGRTVDLLAGPGEAERFIAALLAAAHLRRHLAKKQMDRTNGPEPELRLVRTPREAEEVAAEWMTYLGLGPARVTVNGADGGLDIVAPRGVAQVKMEALPVGRPTVQQLHGCACVESKAGLVFALNGFTPQAVAWADRAGVALFAFDFQGRPQPVNAAARSLGMG